MIAVGFVIAAPELWQRVYAGKSKKETVKGLLIASVLFIFVAFFVGIIGATARTSLPGIAPEQVAISALNYLLPGALQGIGIVLFFAVIMSTIDTLLFIVANNFSNDIYTKYFGRKEKSVEITKLSLLLFTGIPIVVALVFRDIISLGLSFLGMSLCFVPVIIGSFYFKLKPNAVKLALISSVLSIFALLTADIVVPETSVISLPVSLIMLIIGQIIFRNTKK